MSRTGIGGVELTGEDVVIDAEAASLPAMLYRPSPAAMPGPAMILCPGGVGTGMFEIVEWLARGLCDAGILALTTSWRAGVPDRDVDDVAAAIAWLQARPDVDPDRIGIYGMSRGGNAALRAAAVDARIKLCVTFGPVTDLRQQAESTAAYAPGRHQMMIGWLGDPAAKPDYYAEVSAITHAGRIRQPLLMVHGEHDMHSPPEQTLWMKAAIEAGGNHDVELRLMPMMGHYGDEVPNRFAFDKLLGVIVPYLERRL